MPALKDITGNRYRFLTVVCHVKRAGSKKSHWLCRCDCGRFAEYQSYPLTSGKLASCGCKHDELSGDATRKHGMHESTEFIIWLGIKQRCYNSKSKAYPYYGGRGIVMCDAWLESFEQFFADMGRRPSKLHSIDRIDNDGPYSPSNCQWATRKQQRINQRGVVLYDLNGDAVTVADAAKASGLKPSTVHMRMRRGMTFYQAINTPIREA